MKATCLVCEKDIPNGHAFFCSDECEAIYLTADKDQFDYELKDEDKDPRMKGDYCIGCTAVHCHVCKGGDCHTSPNTDTTTDDDATDVPF